MYLNHWRCIRWDRDIVNYRIALKFYHRIQLSKRSWVAQLLFTLKKCVRFNSSTNGGVCTDISNRVKIVFSEKDQKSKWVIGEKHFCGIKSTKWKREQIASTHSSRSPLRCSFESQTERFPIGGYTNAFRRHPTDLLHLRRRRCCHDLSKWKPQSFERRNHLLNQCLKYPWMGDWRARLCGRRWRQLAGRCRRTLNAVSQIAKFINFHQLETQRLLEKRPGLKLNRVCGLEFK